MHRPNFISGMRVQLCVRVCVSVCVTPRLNTCTRKLETERIP